MTVASRANDFCCRRDIFEKASDTVSSGRGPTARFLRALTRFARGDRRAHQEHNERATKKPSTKKTPDTSPTDMLEVSPSASEIDTQGELLSRKSSAWAFRVPASRSLSVACVLFFGGVREWFGARGD